MDVEQVRVIVEEVLGNRTILISTITSIVVSGIFAGIGAYIGSYLQHKAKMKVEREERILTERHNLISDTNKKLEMVKNAFDTLRKTGKMPENVPSVHGETLLLTMVNMELQLNKAILTEKFHRLLKAKYDLVCHIWNKENPWEPFIKEWNHLNDEIQKEMKTTFYNT